LELEYEFWMTERITPTGLNRYGTNFDFAKYGTNLEGYAKRVGLDISTWTEAQKVDCEINKVSEGESGEDHTPRFNLLAAQINPIDLNAYLYAFECLLSEFSTLVGKDAKVWQERAKLRKERIKKYCFDPQMGVYFDYDFKKSERTGIYCVACYLPFVFGIHEDKNEAKRAVEKINAYLVRDFGVASCQEVETHGQHYQWGYPNA
jgi:alpha,alpha-trehalase